MRMNKKVARMTRRIGSRREGDGSSMSSEETGRRMVEVGEG